MVAKTLSRLSHWIHLSRPPHLAFLLLPHGLDPASISVLGAVGDVSLSVTKAGLTTVYPPSG